MVSEAKGENNLDVPAPFFTGLSPENTAGT